MCVASGIVGAVVALAFFGFIHICITVTHEHRNNNNPHGTN